MATLPINIPTPAQDSGNWNPQPIYPQRQPLSWAGTMMAVAVGVLMSWVLGFILFVLFWGAVFSSIASSIHSSTN